MQNLIAKKWNSKNKNRKDTIPIKKNKLIIHATAWIDISQNAEHRKSDTTGQFWMIYIYMKFRKCQNEWKRLRSAQWLLWGCNQSIRRENKESSWVAGNILYVDLGYLYM